jgi:hypothetical protein
LDGGIFLSSIDGGEGRAEAAALCEAHATRRPYDHLLTSIANFRRLAAAKLFRAQIQFSLQIALDPEPNYSEDTLLVMAPGHSLLLLDGGPVVRHFDAMV